MKIKQEELQEAINILPYTTEGVKKHLKLMLKKMKTTTIKGYKGEEKKGWVLTNWAEKTAFIVGVLYFLIMTVAFLSGVMQGLARF